MYARRSLKWLNVSPVELGFIFQNGQPNQDFDSWESRCTGFHFPKRTLKNPTSGSPVYWVFTARSLKLLNGSPVVLGFIFQNGQPNQDFDTWESSCTGFHFPKRTPKNWELYTTVLPTAFLVVIFCWYQICWAYGILVRIIPPFCESFPPFFIKRGAELLKKGAIAPLLRKTGFHFPKRTTKPRLQYMGVQMYWVSFSKTDTQE